MAGRMRPLNIYIEKYPDNVLDINEIKYTFRMLLIIAGFNFTFVSEPGNQAIDICYSRKPIDNCALFIEKAVIRREDVKLPLRILRPEDLILFCFNGDHKIDPVRRLNTRVYLWNDIILSSFYFLSGWQERFIRRDRRDIHYIEESYFHKNKLLHEAPLNRYAFFLRQAFSQSHEPVPLWPSGKKYAVALSHDIDYPEMIKWVEALRYLNIYKEKGRLRELRNIICGAENFWKFSDCTALEKKYGFRSAFYFCGFKGNLLRYIFIAPDPFYDVRKSKFRVLMRQLNEDGFEIGMHSSYLAHRSETMFAAEKRNIEYALGGHIFGNRHHYWHVNPDDPSETALLHERIGLLYDSSLSFEKRCGFRYGLCSPFHLYHTQKKRASRTVQLPPTVMDNHLFGNMRYSHFESWEEEIDSLIETTRNFEGIFVVDYHPRVFNNIFFPGWRDSYEYILKKITMRNDFWSDTPVNIARHFLDRENKILEASSDEDSAHNQ